MTAIMTLNIANLKSSKGHRQNGDGTEFVNSEPVAKAVREAVSRVNKQLADFERIRRFRVLARDFSIDLGELTPTMKIRRAQVLENHREIVSELYLGREESE